MQAAFALPADGERMSASAKPDAGAATGRASTWIRRVTPDLGIRFYSSDAHADRARRPTDAVLFLLAALTLGLISLVAPDPTTADQEFTRLVNDLPGLLGWFWEISYDLLLIWPICLVVASVVARGRLRLLRDQAIALVLGLGLASLVAGGWSTTFTKVMLTE